MKTKLAFTSNHPYIKSWVFETERERDLAEAMAREAIHNGVEINQFRHLFTATLRMLCSKSEWAN